MTPTQTAPPPPAAGPHLLGSSLRRSTGDRMLLGVCGGVAEATGTNVTAVRLGTWALAVVLLPVALLGYLVTALIMPRDDGATLVGPGERNRRDVITAVLTTFVAAPIVLGAADGSLITTGDAFPVLFLGTIAIGVALILRNRRASSPPVTTAGPGNTTAFPGASAGDPFSGTVTGPYTDATTTFVPSAAATAGPDLVKAAEAPTTIGAGPAAALEGDAEHAGDEPSESSEAPTFVRTGSMPLTGDEPTFVRPGGPTPPTGGGGGWGEGPGGPAAEGPGAFMPPPAPTPKRRGLALPVLSVMALIPSAFAVLLAAGLIDSTPTSWSVMLALMAVAAAGGAVAIAILRPSYLGAGLLVALAATFGAMSIGVNQFGPVLDEGLGERTYRPAAADELRTPYLLGAGELTIDLRDLPLAKGSRTRIDARLGFGQLRVVVPKGVRVTAAPGSEATGLTASARQTGATPTQAASAPVIELDIDVRGAQIDLLTGNAVNYANLEVIKSESTGFWGSDTTSGDELRRQEARDRAADARDRAADERDAARSRAEQEREDARDRAEQRRQEAQDRAEQRRENARP